VAEHRRREPEQTLLHEIVREQLENFLARSSSREQPEVDPISWTTFSQS
jgi:hypothetical protein